MNKLKGILPLLKNVGKYTVYVLAFLEIVQFAVDKIDSLTPKEPEKIEENEQVLS